MTDTRQRGRGPGNCGKAEQEHRGAELGGGAGQRGWAERGCGRLFRAEAPPLPPSACPFAGGRQAAIRGASKRQRGHGPLRNWPTWSGRTQIRTALDCRGQPSLLAMSHSRHRAEAPPLQREDSGTFRSVLGRRGRKAQDGWAAGQGRGAGCSAAFWVKLPPSLGVALGPPSRPWGSAARPAPLVTLGG